MSKPRVSLVTCRAIADLDEEDALLVPALAARGIDARPVVWDDPSVDWNEAGLCILRSPHDYAERRDEFVAWAKSVPRLLNPAPIVEWNTDKHYLEDLRARGVPVIPTMWLEPEQNLTKRTLHTRFPASAEFVIKPAIGGGAQDTGRYTANKANTRSLAILHADRLLKAGRSVMIQRYLSSVDTIGETSLVFINGMFQYAVKKEAMLHGPSQGPQEVHTAHVASAEASEAEFAVAQAVYDAVHGVIVDLTGADEWLIYSRIDLAHDDDGNPVVMEVGLTDPSLHFSHHEGALETFADAIAARL